MKIIPSKQTVLLREQRAKVRACTSQSLLFFRNACRGFSFNQLCMQKECADGNMIEKAG